MAARKGRSDVVNVDYIDETPMWSLRVNVKALCMVVFGVTKSVRPFSKSKVFDVMWKAMQSKLLELASPTKPEPEEDDDEARMRDELGLPADEADKGDAKRQKLITRAFVSIYKRTHKKFSISVPTTKGSAEMH